jgi:ribosomal-protein-alanine N-acetyltransferase
MRVVLEPLRTEDAAELFEIRGDSEAMRFWDWPYDATPADTAAAIAYMLHDVAAGNAHYWTVRFRHDRGFVGICDLSELCDEPLSADIGFMIARRLWGQGLASEAVAGVIERARALGLRTIRARIHSDNVRSTCLLTRAGFKQVGVMPAFEIRPGTCRPCTRFELDL